MKKNYFLECCVDSVESAMAAEAGGGNRLELCSNLIIGGTTPTLSLFKEVKKNCSLPIHVLIRPRFGDFLYTEHEVNIMKNDILAFRDAGADGIVIGSLNPDGTLNTEQMIRFISCAGNMSVTLHRAFDMCNDAFLALEQAQELGIHTILTSGLAPNCLEGIHMLQQLWEKSQNKVTILAGSGICDDTLKELVKKTSLTHFHMSGKKVIPSNMIYRNPHVSMGLPGISEYDIWQTDADAIKQARLILDDAK